MKRMNFTLPGNGQDPKSESTLSSERDWGSHLQKDVKCILSSETVRENGTATFRKMLNVLCPVRENRIATFRKMLKAFTYNLQEFRGRRHRTCCRKSHRSHNQNVVIK